jgi:hypothetical protein
VFATTQCISLDVDAPLHHVYMDVNMMIDIIFMHHIGFDNLGQCVGVYNFVEILQCSI